jgi:decaprenyl-phosphate phosphoribosyltransferase
MPGPEHGSNAALALLRACRPRQWAKNVLVVAAPAAAGMLFHPRIAAEVVGAFVVMSMVSSATYLLNDVRDVEQDRRHPRKRFRPIAAGELQVRTALIWASALAVGGVLIGALIAPALGGVALVYMLLTGAYSIWLKHIPFVDVAAIAAGFVLRALAGGAATDLHLSRWFVLVTGFGAIFLVVGKRYAELARDGDGASVRATLGVYTLRGLRIAFNTAALLTFASYCGWAVTRLDHRAIYIISALPLGLWLGRYTALVRRGEGEAPEDVVLRDRSLILLGALWAVLCGAGIYVGV